MKTIAWNVTYACNYRCEVCFTDAGEERKRELNPREALAAVDSIAETGVRDVLISGGEPFMRKDLVQILTRMASHGIGARIASNGSLLTEELLAKLKRDTLTKSFQISLDTLDPSLYAKFHRCPAKMLNRALSALDLIQSFGFHTTISVRSTQETLPGICGLLDLATERNWGTVTLHIPVQTGRVEGLPDREQDAVVQLEPVLSYFASLPKRWLAETYIPWAEYHPVFKALSQKVEVVHRGCRAARDRLTIHPAGDIAPCICMDLEEAYLGNVKRDSLSKVFEEHPKCQLMRAPWEHGVCSDCENVFRCGAGCRATALAFTGAFAGIDPQCPVRRANSVSRAVPERAG